MTHNPMQFDVTKLPERELGQMQRRAAKPKPIPSPESPRQANSGARVQPVRCHCASALKWDALRRFCGDGFLGIELQTAHCAADPREGLALLGQYGFPIRT